MCILHSKTLYGSLQFVGPEIVPVLRFLGAEILQSNFCHHLDKKIKFRYLSVKMFQQICIWMFFMFHDKKRFASTTMNLIFYKELDVYNYIICWSLLNSCYEHQRRYLILSTIILVWCFVSPSSETEVDYPTRVGWRSLKLCVHFWILYLENDYALW